MVVVANHVFDSQSAAARTRVSRRLLTARIPRLDLPLSPISLVGSWKLHLEIDADFGRMTHSELILPLSRQVLHTFRVRPSAK